MAREHIEQRDILPDLLEQPDGGNTNQERPVVGIIAYADDFIVSSDGDEADRVWDRTTVAPGDLLHVQWEGALETQDIGLHL